MYKITNKQIMELNVTFVLLPYALAKYSPFPVMQFFFTKQRKIRKRQYNYPSCEKKRNVKTRLYQRER